MQRFTWKKMAVLGAWVALALNFSVVERGAQAFFQGPEGDPAPKREIGKPPVQGVVPDCMSNDLKPMPLDNARVLELKRNTRNQYKDRGYVQGTVSRIFKRNGDHSHFEIMIGSGPKDGIEIVYNRDFGNPAVEPGDHVIACGDYITSYAKAAGYDASPSKALIHWVHENERGTPHPDGFVIVNRTDLYGYGQKAYPVRVAQ